MTTGPNNPSEHCFGTPMPGQGRSRICIRCGGREAVVSDHPCPGSTVETYLAEISPGDDYNPLEAEQ